MVDTGFRWREPEEVHPLQIVNMQVTFKVVRNKKLTPWLSCLKNYWRLTAGPLAKHWLKTQKGEEQLWILKNQWRTITIMDPRKMFQRGKNSAWVGGGGGPWGLQRHHGRDVWRQGGLPMTTWWHHHRRRHHHHRHQCTLCSLFSKCAQPIKLRPIIKFEFW